MEPAVGASVCASGSQVWNGTAGILTRNAMVNSQKTSAGDDIPPLRADIWAILTLPPLSAIARMTPRSMIAPAAKEYSRYLVAACRRFDEPHPPMMKYIGTSTDSHPT